MSYDLMVFDPDAAPKERESFMSWYDKQTEWSEDHSYNDPIVTAPALQAWFREMIQFFPPMNGPLAADSDASEVTDHSIGKSVIYSAFAWSVAEHAYNKMRELAIKHRVGFFDVSSDDGEILFPPASN
ncbi:hypothetical protein [Rhodanobacter sp. DHB23]|uniref:hypothetical protein n=1 Tax=Rhodanobacter sp. DHB23 TaxID=2775923 RepID=UPI0017826660|nr:hypothetical protein [Rhodanobacter sp. DHB23]MBD8871203.1 hypothetical protein [Rhodanobacter sp. DHB23]